jgi:hypothetical protein
VFIVDTGMLSSVSVLLTLILTSFGYTIPFVFFVRMLVDMEFNIDIGGVISISISFICVEKM